MPVILQEVSPCKQQPLEVTQNMQNSVIFIPSTSIWQHKGVYQNPTILKENADHSTWWWWVFISVGEAGAGRDHTALYLSGCSRPVAGPWRWQVEPGCTECHHKGSLEPVHNAPKNQVPRTLHHVESLHDCLGAQH